MAQFISVYVRGVHGQFSSLLSLQSSGFSLLVVSQSRKNLESKEITWTAIIMVASRHVAIEHAVGWWESEGVFENFTHQCKSLSIDFIAYN